MLLGSVGVKAVHKLVCEIDPMCHLETQAHGPGVTRYWILSPICVTKFELFSKSMSGIKKYGYQNVI